jgi:hypothetical protein
MWETRNAYRIFMQTPLGTLRRRWENNIKIDLRELCDEGGRVVPNGRLWY